MPVQIDEVSAEVEPMRPEQTAATSPRPGESTPEAELRQQLDLLVRLEVRAARVRAD
jgi:hypothetical protein